MISSFQTVVWCCGLVQSLSDVILKIEKTLKTHTTTQKRTNNGLRNTKKPQCITREPCSALAMKSRFSSLLTQFYACQRCGSIEQCEKVRILSHFSPSHEPLVILYLVLHRGTKRRFPPQYIENTFQATQSTYRCLEMNSEWCYKICIISVRSSQDNFSLFKVIRAPVLLPRKFQKEFDFYEIENFSNSSLHRAFESENFGFPFYYEKQTNLENEM